MEIKSTSKQSQTLAYNFSSLISTVEVCSYIIETIVKFTNQKGNLNFHLRFTLINNVL